MNKTIKWKLAQFAEIRWWKNYLGKQSVADYKSYKLDYWQNFLKKISSDFAISPNETVLDAGCGPAGIFMALPTDLSIAAVDPLLEAYEEELDHFSKKDYPHVSFEAKGIEEVIDEEAYNHVFCLNCINHVSNLELALDRLVGATKQGGVIYLSIDAHNHQVLKWLFRAVPLDILHPHQYDLSEYSQMLETRGCEVQQSIRVKKEAIFDYYLLVARKKRI